MCPDTELLVSPLDGTVRWFGVAFPLEALNPLTIRGFDVHIHNNKRETIEVFYSAKELDKVEPEDWQLLCTDSVVGLGYGKPVSVGQCLPLSLSAGETVSLYVTVVDDSPMVMRDDRDDAKAVVENGDLSMGRGAAVTYKDEARFGGYSFNGNIVYTVCEDRGGAVEMDWIAGRRSCGWLRGNWDRFSYVCEFAPVAEHCPVSCGFCGQ